MSSFDNEGDLISFACCSSSTTLVLVIRISGYFVRTNGYLQAALCPIVHNLISILQSFSSLISLVGILLLEGVD